MKEFYRRVAARIKRRWWVCAAIILILGIIGPVMPFGKEEQSYSAEAAVKLGSYENNSFNDPKQVIQLLTSTAFYDDHLEEDWFAENSNSLTIKSASDNTIYFIYRGSSKAEAAQSLKKITTAFLAVDNTQFNLKRKIIQKNIDALETLETSSDTSVDKQRFLYELETSQLAIKPATLVKDVSLIENARTLTAKEIAIVGVILGVMFSILMIVAPEYIRNYPQITR
ncbi:hypothetical protein [Niallia nealsonii]|uniref:Uncharacterized protein n=1 Tax=Niallia nealsonii TaxID=115979 RepID=A0A2N0YYF0_9BACI|nr:hypothetical protein [Niallia nealsonii]PKG22284.1 hypothetical protein CWS01_17790 [Niallia nealsonii]